MPSCVRSAGPSRRCRPPCGRRRRGRRRRRRAGTRGGRRAGAVGGVAAAAPAGAAGEGHPVAPGAAGRGVVRRGWAARCRAEGVAVGRAARGAVVDDEFQAVVEPGGLPGPYGLLAAPVRPQPQLAAAGAPQRVGAGRAGRGPLDVGGGAADPVGGEVEGAALRLPGPYGEFAEVAAVAAQFEDHPGEVAAAGAGLQPQRHHRADDEDGDGCAEDGDPPGLPPGGRCVDPYIDEHGVQGAVAVAGVDDGDLAADVPEGRVGADGEGDPHVLPAARPDRDGGRFDAQCGAVGLVGEGEAQRVRGAVVVGDGQGAADAASGVDGAPVEGQSGGDGWCAAAGAGVQRALVGGDAGGRHEGGEAQRAGRSGGDGDGAGEPHVRRLAVGRPAVVGEGHVDGGEAVAGEPRGDLDPGELGGVGDDDAAPGLHPHLDDRLLAGARRGRVEGDGGAQPALPDGPHGDLAVAVALGCLDVGAPAARERVLHPEGLHGPVLAAEFEGGAVEGALGGHLPPLRVVVGDGHLRVVFADGDGAVGGDGRDRHVEVARRAAPVAVGDAGAAGGGEGLLECLVDAGRVGDDPHPRGGGRQVGAAAAVASLGHAGEGGPVDAAAEAEGPDLDLLAAGAGEFVGEPLPAVGLPAAAVGAVLGAVADVEPAVGEEEHHLGDGGVGLLGEAVDGLADGGGEVRAGAHPGGVAPGQFPHAVAEALASRGVGGGQRARFAHG